MAFHLKARWNRRRPRCFLYRRNIGVPGGLSRAFSQYLTSLTAGRRGLARREPEGGSHLSVDEKSVQRGDESVTVGNDLQGQRVLFVADDRKQERLDSFFAGLTPAQRDGIEAIALDMWEPSIQAVEPPRARRARADPVRHISSLVHRITNAVSEGINPKNQWITSTARGFRDWEHFRAAIYFHGGGLNLSPH